MRKQDDSYLALCRQIWDMERNYPFILSAAEGEGEISLTAEGHRILVEYFRLSLKRTIPQEGGFTSGGILTGMFI